MIFEDASHCVQCILYACVGICVYVCALFFPLLASIESGSDIFRFFGGANFLYFNSAHLPYFSQIQMLRVLIAFKWQYNPRCVKCFTLESTYLWHEFACLRTRWHTGSIMTTHSHTISECVYRVYNQLVTKLALRRSEIFPADLSFLGNKRGLHPMVCMRGWRRGEEWGENCH